MIPDDRILTFWPLTILIGPEGGRGLAEYEAELLILRGELRGKIVLDLGCGCTEKFAREIHQAGINCQVISVSPDYI
ncbi:MAG TPA: hypothetical protein VGA49_03075, partial [Patescibacteria group bacterium]